MLLVLDIAVFYHDWIEYLLLLVDEVEEVGDAEE